MKKTDTLINALDLFFTPLFQTSVIKGTWVEVRPTNPIEDNTPIDFVISGSGTEYLDLANTFMKAKVQVTTPDGLEGFPADTDVAVKYS